MKNNLVLSDGDENGGSGSSLWWWRTGEEFDENGNFKVDVSEIWRLSPRLKVIREMERLRFLCEEGLDEMRQKLLSYRAGDFWVPIGGINKEDIDIPPVITLVLTGLVHSGKSSLINLMYSVLGRSGLIPFAQTSGESSNYTTMYLEEHNILRSPRSGLCVFDTRGLEQDHMWEGLEEISTFISDGVKHHHSCHRSTDDQDLFKGSSMSNISNARYKQRRVNCVIVVADLAQIHNAFKLGGHHMNSVEALKSLFHLTSIKNSNENPMLILTHGDALNSEDRIDGRVKICEYLGIPETSGAYDIPCLTEQGVLAEESDPATAFALTEAIYRALLQSDRSHLPKRKFKDWIILFFSWIMIFFASIFATLANFFSKFGHHKKKLKM